MPPEIVTGTIIESHNMVQMLLWVGSIMVISMSTAITVLWKAKESRDKYIREQDRANIIVLSEIANNYKMMGVDVSKIEITTSKEIKPNVEEIRNNITRIINEGVIKGSQK
jgi:NADH:ubiquinone oxidoreductase subunit 6 (subunit J)